MIIFSLPDYRYLLSSFERSKNFQPGKYATERFENKTLLLFIKTKVSGESCVVIGGSAPDADLIETLLLCHTLKKEGAKKVTAILPFIPYARQDKNKKGESWGADWLGKLCASSGIDRVITLDIHSQAAARFPIPVLSLSPAFALVEKIKKEIAADAVCVAPDEGAIDNCMVLNRALKNETAIVFFKKKRSQRGVQMLSLKGEIGSDVVVADDILDTGETMVRACEKLRDAGVKKITVVVTHGLFSSSKWKRLFRLGVRKIYCTDSHPGARRIASSKIRVVSVGKIIADSLL